MSGFAAGQPAHVAPKLRGLERQLLQTCKEHMIHAALPLEVVAALLEQPANDRHDETPLDEQHECGCAAPTMRLILQRCLQPPGVGIAKQIGEQQRVAIAFGNRRVQEPLDVGKELGIVEGRRGAVEGEPLLEPRADTLAQLRRHGIDRDLTGQDRRVRPVGPRRSR